MLALILPEVFFVHFLFVSILDHQFQTGCGWLLVYSVDRAFTCTLFGTVGVHLTLVFNMTYLLGRDPDLTNFRCLARLI